MSHRPMTMDTTVNRTLCAFAAGLFDYPTAELIKGMHEAACALTQWDAVGETTSLADFVASAAQADLRDLEVEYNRLFVIKHPDLPGARNWLAKSGDFRQENLLADLAGIYKAWGVQVASQAHELPDHQSIMLQFMGYLFLKEELARQQERTEEADISCQAQLFFWQNYLESWLPSCLEAVATRTESTYYQLGAAVVQSALEPLALQLATHSTTLSLTGGNSRETEN